MSDFEGPLLVRQRTEFTSIDFGRIEAAPEIEQLRHTLNALLLELIATLPKAQQPAAKSIIRGYAGGRNDFYQLFYPPSWSFLHWATVSPHPSPTAEVRLAAQTAHALSLFIHLWDDHLCDRQLPIDLLRLQLRTLAWQRYSESSYRLVQGFNLPAEIVSQHMEQYLTAPHGFVLAESLEEYCEHFRQEIGIWTLVPKLLGHGLYSGNANGALPAIFTGFAIAWRLVDDIQDIHLDVACGKQSAVCVAMDELTRQRWEDCRLASFDSGKLDAATWKELRLAVRQSGVIQRLIAKINDLLATAAQSATAHGWFGLARELDQSRVATPAFEK